MRALIAMSGGVDSSVAALLAMEQGLQCIGGTMHLHDKTCAADAASVAQRLGIPFQEFDCTDRFRQQVMDYFVHCYEEGGTPNPCIECNRHLKFGHLLDIARELGCNYVVTGHYAQIEFDTSTGRYLLKKAADTTKDQSYFLCRLTQDQLAHTLFPLGGLTKIQAREIAEKNGFINAKKRDSQDICFVPDGDYMAFLERYTGKNYPGGNFLNRQGNVVGTHCGAVAYTIGQRKGLGLAMGAPVYVCSKDMAANTVTVGPNEALFHSTLLANDWNWISIPSLNEPLRCKAKARSRMTEQDAVVYPEQNGFARVVFDEPQRAITPGQSVVLYAGDTVIAGGTITNAI
jgi:tRNA-specific 2-thiouridylase